MYAQLGQFHEQIPALMQLCSKEHTKILIDFIILDMEDRQVFLEFQSTAYRYGYNVTFEQFAYFVAWQVKKMKGDSNVHWRPFYLQCPYCDNKYDTFIGRMETFERDVRYVSEGLPSDPKNNLL